MKGSGFCQAPHGEERRTRAASDPELIPYCTGNRNSISVESGTWSDIWQERGRYPCGVFPRTLLQNACLFWKLAVSANNKTHYTIFTFACPRRFTGRSWKTAALAEQFSYIKNFCWKLNRHQITLLDPVLAVTFADSAALAMDSFMCVACFSGRYNPKQTPQKTKTNLPLYVWLILNTLLSSGALARAPLPCSCFCISCHQMPGVSRVQEPTPRRALRLFSNGSGFTALLFLQYFCEPDTACSWWGGTVNCHEQCNVLTVWYLGIYIIQVTANGQNEEL